MLPQSVKHASFLCSSNSELQLAAFEPALKVHDFVQTCKPQQPTPPSASHTHHPKKKRLGPVPPPVESLHRTVPLALRNGLRKSYTRRIQVEVLSYLQQESESVLMKVFENGYH